MLDLDAAAGERVELCWASEEKSTHFATHNRDKHIGKVERELPRRMK